MINATASRRKSYYRTLSLSLIISTFPLLLLAISIFLFGTKRIEKEASLQFERYFSMIAGNLDNQLQEIEIVGLQWGFNETLILNYVNANFPEDFMLARSFQESLFHITTLSPLIKECYFWSISKPSEWLSDNGSVTIDKGDFLDITDIFFRAFLDPRKMQWIFNGIFDENRENNDTFFLLVKAPIFMNSHSGILLLEIEKKEVIKLLSPENESSYLPKESVILFDQNMEIIASQGEYDAYFLNKDSIDSQIEIDDSGVCVQDGILFFFKKIKNKNWTAMSIVPMDRITKPVADITQIIILLMLFFLLGAIILSYKASQTFYNPIKKMVETLTNDRDRFFNENDSEIDILNKYLSRNSTERKNINSELAKYKKEVKVSTFSQLLNGDLNDMSDVSIRLRLKEIGITIEQKKIGIIIIQLLIESYKMDHKALNILRFTAISVIKSNNQLSEANIIPIRDHMIAIIVSFDENEASPKSRLWNYAHGVKDILASGPNIQTAVAISDVINDLSTTHANYIRILKTLSYRKLGAKDQIIDANSISSYDQAITSYPFKTEKELLHAFQMGWVNETENEVESFFESLSDSSNTIYFVKYQVRLLLSNLLFTVMQSGFDPWELYNDRDLYEELKQLNQVNSIKKWLKTEVISLFVNKINELQDIEYRRIVNDVYDIIEKEYSSPMLCLTHCSEILNTYPQKICLAFKSVENENFVVFLTNFRLEKARNLLKYSDLSINDIAERVGYQASYFNRVFKKHYGVTPGEYRNN